MWTGSKKAPWKGLRAGWVGGRHSSVPGTKQALWQSCVCVGGRGGGGAVTNMLKTVTWRPPAAQVAALGLECRSGAPRAQRVGCQPWRSDAFTLPVTPIWGLWSLGFALQSGESPSPSRSLPPRSEMLMPCTYRAVDMQRQLWSCLKGHCPQSLVSSQTWVERWSRRAAIGSTGLFLGVLCAARPTWDGAAWSV